MNQQLPLYILVCVVGFGVAFGLTYVYYGKHAFDSNKNSKKEDIEKKQNTFKQEPSHVSDEVIDAPVSGKIEALNLVSDKAFASGMMGKGIAIEPSSNNIVSPVNGTITVAYPTGHAYGIKSDDGAEILIHLGIDTVNLKGKGFNTVVKQGQKINKGELLGTYDYQEIGKEGYDNIVIVLITNSKDYAEVDPIASGNVQAQQKLIALTEPTMSEQAKGTVNELN